MIPQAEFHPEVLSEDIPGLALEFPERDAYDELELALRKALLTIARDPANAGKECEFPPLVGWRRLKFHSMLKPPIGTRPDMRIVFRRKPGGLPNEFQVRAIGKRLRFGATDVYVQARKTERETGYR
jgi:hypothetical protein